MLAEAAMREISISNLMLALRNIPATTGPTYKRYLPQEFSPVEATAPFPPDHPFYTITNAAWRCRSRLDIECLSRAANEITARHSFLRCTVKHLKDHGWRFVSEQARKVPLFFLDAGGVGRYVERAARALLNDAVYRPFDFGTEGPLRVVVVRISDEDYFVAFVLNHMFCDAYSLRVCSFELAVLYDSFSRNQISPLRELPLEYFDCIASIEEWKKSAQAEECRSYWLRYLEGCQELPFSGAVTPRLVSLTVPRDLSDKLRAVSAVEKVGPDIFWEAVHHITLWRLFNVTDITTGFSHVGRHIKELTGLIGGLSTFAFNRSHINAHITFRDFLHCLRDNRVQSFPYYSAPMSIPMPCALGATNYHPREFLPIASFGTTLEFPLAPIPPYPSKAVWDVGRKKVSWGYGLGILDRAEFEIICHAGFSRPASPEEFVAMVEHIARAAIMNPDCVLSDFPVLQ